ncbi:Dicer-like protein 1 [Entomophthora muscae]|uniref:Dicer-like protein 1 n=1 Tax=Entomophthora muscae TaxID=34485 RepID=A0ACC2TUU5_9FUNG|nr:Dicer-like protein 1 [Entomophthora muscae]
MADGELEAKEEIPYLANLLPMHHRQGTRIAADVSNVIHTLHEETTLPEEDAKLLAPRQYQIELLERALESNVIAVLETGAGKTLVAVMLIKEMVMRQLILRKRNPDAQHRVTIFLVNLVPLVFQQAKVVEANVQYRLEKLCGEMGVDFWDIVKWRRLIETSDILIMTAQIFLNMLRHAYISMDEICLLVFDECHHAQKKHPYNVIMREFYHSRPASSYRPKVFGMTASPLGGRVDAIAAAGSLELALDAQIYTICTQDELRSFVSRPKEIVVTFAPNPYKYCSNRLISLVQSECSPSKLIQNLCEAAVEVMHQLGPWGALLLFRTTLDSLAKDKASPESRHADGKFTPSMLAFEESYTTKALQIYEQYKDQIGEDDPLDISPANLGIDQISPKGQMLLQTLRAARKVPNFCGIVFVERRCVASALKLMIEAMASDGLGFIKCGCLLGHGAGKGSRSMQMNFTQQNRMIRDFNRGVVNLLVATNVAEEGLDIQPCNMVIRFDFFSNLISYIQSRGRARQQKSAYLLMQERGNLTEASLLQQLQRAEHEMVNWCQSLPEDRFRQFSNQDLYSLSGPELDFDLVNSHTYRVPETGATISLESSVGLLFNFCSLLPKDDYCVPLPRFDVVRQNQYYKCTLKLPPNSPLKAVFGELAFSKTRAAQSCAFKACVELHLMGALDNHLLPPRNEELGPNDADPVHKNSKDAAVEGSWLAQHEYQAKLPNFWQDVGDGWQEVYVNAVDMSLLNKGQEKVYRPLAILTRKPFPTFDPLVLFFQGEPARIQLISASQRCSSPGEPQLRQLFNFTVQALCAILHKKLAGELDSIMYLLAPLVSEPTDGLLAWDCIDWDLVRDADNSKPVALSAISKELIVCDAVNSMNRYYVEEVLYHLTPSSNIPASLCPAGDEATTFSDYYAKQFKRSVSNMEQPVLKVERVALAYNYLTRDVRGSTANKKHCINYLLPEFCCAYWIPAAVLRSLALIPSLMMRVDALLLIKEIKGKFDIGFVRDELLLEAFTSTTANVSMNYERLELLGDSYLKFVASLDVYVRFPKKHEGQLHCQRVRIIGNRTMYRAAKERDLPAYFITQPFNRRTWCPPNVTFESMPPAKPAVRSLSDKCLADVVEATLGASLLSVGRSQTISCAKSLGIPIGDVHCWDDFKANYVLPEQPNTYESKCLLDTAQIESIIGYTFKNINFLVEAFTHASYPHAVTPSYQRMEFLGDAVLDYFVVSYLFKKYPNVSPGGITEMKDACVSNNTLAAIMETFGLHRHILHFSNKLMHAMEDFMHVMANLRSQWEEAKEGAPKGEYWFDINAPKVISDVLEAVIGAVFVDSGFNFDAPYAIFTKFIQPLYDNHIAPNMVIVHPTIQLTRFIHRFGCQKLEIVCTSLDDEEKLTRPPEDHVTCTIKVHGHALVTHSRRVVKAARKYAAQDFLDLIKANPKALHPLCQCPTRHIVAADDTNTLPSSTYQV